MKQNGRKRLGFILIGLVLFSYLGEAQNSNIRPRKLGIEFGVFQTGPKNAITDVSGVLIGHENVEIGDSIRTGVTAILPHGQNLFENKVPAAIYLGNGFGKLMGYSQVEELGQIETPIVLTNTLSVPTAANAVITYSLEADSNEIIRSVNPVVGETNDGFLNDIRARAVTQSHVIEAIRKADTSVMEGNIGSGVGTICFGFKGGIGTASRRLPKSLGGYTIGVLVQTNFGGDLKIAGVPVGKLLGNSPYLKEVMDDSDGSCMIIVGTDAPLQARNLKRLAKRAMLGLARTGGYASNGSGDYVIAFSNHKDLFIPYSSQSSTQTQTTLRNDAMSPLFLATVEATEEAIINSLFAARTQSGQKNRVIESMPIQKVLELLLERGAIK